jgi:hypothetical protein
MNLLLYTLDQLNHSSSFSFPATIPVHLDLCIKTFMHCNSDTKRFYGTNVASVVSESK